MTATEIRNALIKGLYEYLGDGIPVYRSGQVSEEQSLPYVIYTVVTTNGSGRTMGHYSVCREGERTEEIREEQESMTISFTACSQNRTDGNGNYIHGEDEAQEIAEMAHAWFVHAGYDYFVKNKIVIADVTEVRGRNSLAGNVEANRKGFDIICNYISEDRRNIPFVGQVMIGREEKG